MEASGRDEARVHIFSDALKRHVALILLVAVVLTAAAGAVLFTRTPHYTATAQVLLRPVPGNALSPDSATSGQQVTVAMETEASLVNSPSVIKDVNKALGTDLTAGSKAVTATVPPNTEIVRVDFTATSPSRAQRGAQEFARAFLAHRAAQAKATQQQQLDSLRDQVEAAQSSLGRAAAAASSDNPPPDSSARTQLYADRIATLQDSISDLGSTSTSPGSFVTPAQLPIGPSGINPWLLVAATAVVGLTLGVCLALWRERNDDRIRGDAEPLLSGVPVFATLPAPAAGAPSLVNVAADGTGQEGSGPGHPGGGDPANADALHDAYRHARAGLVARTARPATVAVCAIDPQVQSGPVAANLAVSLARSGYRVVVVEATETREVSHAFGITPEPGLDEVLTGEYELTQALVDRHGVRVLPVGSDPEAARERYAGESLRRVLSRLRESADFVLVAAPDASTPDADSITFASESVLLVAADKQTTHQEVGDAAVRAEQLGVRVLGAVVTPRTHARPAEPRSTDAVSQPERPMSPEPSTPTPERSGAGNPVSS